MSFLIRRLGVEDLPAMLLMENACFTCPWTEGMLRSELESPRCLYFGAFSDGVPAGYAGFQYVMDEGYVNNVATGPDFRRQGVGRLLLERLEAEAMALGLSFLTLEVRESNLPALALYGSRGYVRVGRRPDYYEKPREAALLLTLNFPRGAQNV